MTDHDPNLEHEMKATNGLSTRTVETAIDAAVGGSEAVQIAPGAIEQSTRGEVDIQIVTAQRFKRSIRTFMDDLHTMACLNEQVAASCTYALPRDGKTITGPSARFAELVAAAYGHLRVASMIVGEDDRFITVRGMAWDLQRNVAFSCEVRRRITKSNGQRYGDDMIVTTTNAASSIALRNAVLKVVPAALWRPSWEEAKQTAAGDFASFEKNRAAALAAFKKIGVEESRVFALLDVKGHEDIDLERLATLRGLMVAIKEGATSVAEAFPTNERQDRAAAAHATVTQAAPKSEAPKPAARTEIDTDITGDDIPF